MFKFVKKPKEEEPSLVMEKHRSQKSLNIFNDKTRKLNLNNSKQSEAIIPKLTEKTPEDLRPARQDMDEGKTKHEKMDRISPIPKKIAAHNTTYAKPNTANAFISNTQVPQHKHESIPGSIVSQTYNNLQSVSNLNNPNANIAAKIANSNSSNTNQHLSSNAFISSSSQHSQQSYQTNKPSSGGTLEANTSLTSQTSSNQVNNYLTSQTQNTSHGKISKSQISGKLNKSSNQNKFKSQDQNTLSSIRNNIYLNELIQGSSSKSREKKLESSESFGISGTGSGSGSTSTGNLNSLIGPNLASNIINKNNININYISINTFNANAVAYNSSSATNTSNTNNSKNNPSTNIGFNIGCAGDQIKTLTKNNSAKINPLINYNNSSLNYRNLIKKQNSLSPFTVKERFDSLEKDSIDTKELGDNTRNNNLNYPSITHFMNNSSLNKKSTQNVMSINSSSSMSGLAKKIESRTLSSNLFNTLKLKSLKNKTTTNFTKKLGKQEKSLMTLENRESGAQLSSIKSFGKLYTNSGLLKTEPSLDLEPQAYAQFSEKPKVFVSKDDESSTAKVLNKQHSNSKFTPFSSGFLNLEPMKLLSTTNLKPKKMKSSKKI